jgi:glycosyltransferase involved in cell wall biosynthesis
MNLRAVLPCYNEPKTIEQVVNTVKAVIGDEGDIIIVDDYSTDGAQQSQRDSNTGFSR